MCRIPPRLQPQRTVQSGFQFDVSFWATLVAAAPSRSDADLSFLDVKTCPARGSLIRLQWLDTQADTLF
jgi:hypothetical protein